MKTEKNKYFIALIPPDPLQSEIGEIKQLFHTDYGSKGALRSPAHITLHMPFLWKQKKEDKLIDLLVHATKETSFDLILNGFGCFVPRTVYIKVNESAQLNDFQKRLATYTKRALNLFNATHNRGFHPHITVAFRDLKKGRFFEAWSEFELKPFESMFPVNSFWLLKHDGKEWKAYKEFQFAE